MKKKWRKTDTSRQMRNNVTGKISFMKKELQIRVENQASTLMAQITVQFHPCEPGSIEGPESQALSGLQLAFLLQEIVVSFFLVAAEGLSSLAVDVVVDVAVEEGAGVDASHAQLLARGIEDSLQRRRRGHDGVTIAITRTRVTGGRRRGSAWKGGEGWGDGVERA